MLNNLFTRNQEPQRPNCISFICINFISKFAAFAQQSKNKLLTLRHLELLIVSVTFTGVETSGQPWVCHRREHFLLTAVSEVGQTYQQNGRKLRGEVFLSATIVCKHLKMVSKLIRYENASVVFNFPSSLHKVVNSSKHRVQSNFCINACKVSVTWVVKQIFFQIFDKLDSAS